VTAFFSMFMSNTATTATMLAVVLPMLASIEPGDRLRPALALAVPLAANIGGIATPVGTPPNAIAVGSLADAGITVSFGRWMAMAVPFTALLLVASWAVLVRRFRSRAESLEVRLTTPFDRSRPALIFYATFAATVALWLTEPLHGIPSAIVGFFPVVVLLGTGVFDHTHLQRIPWHVLWLVAGGIALGIGVAATGVDDWIVSRFDWSAPPALLVVAGLALLALLLSTVISNTAAANLLIPIGLALAASDAVSIDPITVGFFIAVGASLAMALPISTPPNALAYSTGSVRTGDMAVVGGLVGIIGLALLLFGTPLLWAATGVAP
jgi:sodium-dependent dicarboxylate transporter 2/3/5